jgi:hypothetical protein
MKKVTSRLRPHVFPEPRSNFSGLHGVISQKRGFLLNLNFMNPQRSYFLPLLRQALGLKACCSSSNLVSMKTFTWGGYQPTAQPPNWKTELYSSSDPYPLTLLACVIIPAAFAPAAVALRVIGESSRLCSQSSSLASLLRQLNPCHTATHPTSLRSVRKLNPLLPRDNYSWGFQNKICASVVTATSPSRPVLD